MRVFRLRRVFTDEIMLAGMRNGQPWVALTDRLDDRLFAALKREARIATARTRRRK